VRDQPSPRLGFSRRGAAVTQMLIKPYREQQEEQARRERQRQLFRRNQTIGLVLLAAAILAWWLFHTNPRWIFPPGWWRP